MNTEYKNIKSLLDSLQQGVSSLEGGNLSVNELDAMLQDARNLHERIAILQYLSVAPKAEPQTIQKEEPKPVGLNFSFDFDESSVDTEKNNQTNLLDAIDETPKKASKPEPIIEEPIAPEVPTPVAVIPDPVVEPEPEVLVASEEPTTNTETSTSINDKFSEHAEKETLAEQLGQIPITDLNEFIGLNQKFLFMNDLFEGENALYKEAINSLNSFTNFIDADLYMNTLRVRHNWDATHQTTKEFIELVERRYI